ncbi:MAG: hypothetical protein K2J92_06210 [Muribaculaceae bacterium]|nr:hypothetical protein [Bacteroides sp.]MDE6680927.1 hypothetical protein [Muribaculaceae bacterium]MDE7188933.1 hypothetical protein [Muribaculaceae bacterium]
MKLSNRTKRNIALTLMCIGIMCTLARIWKVAMVPTSGMAWFELCSIIILTYFSFDRFNIYRKRVKKGIVFGRR